MPFLTLFTLILRISSVLILVGTVIYGIVFPAIGMYFCKVSATSTGCREPFGWMSSLWDRFYNDLFLTSLYLLGLPLLIYGVVVIILLAIPIAIINSKNTGFGSLVWKSIYILFLGTILLSNTVDLVNSQQKSTILTDAAKDRPGFTISDLGGEMAGLASRAKESVDNHAKQTELSYNTLKNKNFSEEEIESMIQYLNTDLKNEFYQEAMWCEGKYSDKVKGGWIDGSHINGLMQALGMGTTAVGIYADLRFLSENPSLTSVLRTRERSKKIILQRAEKRCSGE